MESFQPYKLDAPCGANKTGAIIRYAGEAAKTFQAKSLIVEPTKQVCHQVEERAKRMFPDVDIYCITGDTHPHAVTKTLIGHFQSASDEGQIVVCTHSAFFNVVKDYFHDPQRWSVYFDEQPNIDFTRYVNIPDTHGLLTEHLEVGPSRNGVYAPIWVKDGHRHSVEAIARNANNDEIYAMLADMARVLLDPHWQVEVKLQNWLRIQEGNICPRDVEAGQSIRGFDGAEYPLEMHAWLDWRIFDQQFESVTFAAANFDHYYINLLWQELEFRPHRKLEQLLDYRDHSQVGRRLHLSYAHDRDGQVASRNFHNSPSQDDETKTNLQVSLEKAHEIWNLDTDRVCYLTNKADADLAQEMLPQCQPIPSSPHGNNAFRDYENIILAASFLPDPHEARWLSSRGIDGEAVQEARHVQQLYQALMRVSLRNPQATSRVHALISDKETAELLRRFFPGARMGPAGCVATSWRNNRRYVDFKEKWRQNKATARARRNEDITSAVRDLIEQLGPDKTENLSLRDLVEESDPTLDLIGRLKKGEKLGSALSYKGPYTETADPAIPPFLARSESDQIAVRPGTFCIDVYDKQIHRDVAVAQSWGQVKQDLVGLAQQVMPAKKAQRMIYPCLFRHVDGAETEKGKANATVASWAIVDFDDGVVRAEDMPDLFPDLEFLIVPSHSDTEKHTKFHMFIPYIHAVGPEQHEHFLKQFRRLFKQHGYHLKKESRRFCGIDDTKTNSAAGFFLPSKPAEIDSYVVYNRGRAVDPREWAGTGETWTEPTVIVDEEPLQSLSSSEGRRRAEEDLERRVALIAATPEGQRHIMLLKKSVVPFAHVRRGWLSYHDTYHRLYMASSLPDREKRQVLRDANRYSARLNL